MKISYSLQASADLAKIFDYIDERHPPGAIKVKSAIRQSIALLEQFPLLGVGTDEPGIRMLVVSRYPYLVY